VYVCVLSSRSVYLAVASFPPSCRAHWQLRSSVAQNPDCNFLRWWKHACEWCVLAGRRGCRSITCLPSMQDKQCSNCPWVHMALVNPLTSKVWHLDERTPSVLCESCTRVRVFGSATGSLNAEVRFGHTCL